MILYPATLLDVFVSLVVVDSLIHLIYEYKIVVPSIINEITYFFSIWMSFIFSSSFPG